MKIKSKQLLILPLLLLFVFTACDSDNNTNAQDMTDVACPCFSADDIKDDAMGKDFFGCALGPKNLVVSLDLSEGETGFLIEVNCPDANFGFCQCSDGVRGTTSNSVTKDQYFDCVDILTDAIVNEFGQSSQSMCLITD